MSALLLWTAACSPAEPAPMPAMSQVELPESNEALHGAIDGLAFRLRDARFVVVDGPNRRRVDLLLADRSIELCGLPITRPHTATVWIRLRDRTTLEPGLFEVDEHTEDIEVHYQRPVDREFHESHRAVARMRIDTVEPNIIRGRIHACFADASQSCVGGTFAARPCLSRIDGRAIREPPGLSDEALEAFGRRAP